MKFSAIIVSATALAMGASAAVTNKDPTLLVGSVNSDRKCDPKAQITKWKIERDNYNRCVVFDEELPGVEDYAIKSLKVDKLTDPSCGLWVYSDHGCHMNAHRVEPKTCMVGDRWGWRSYALYCLDN